jgi:recombinational DNA repair protein RecT
MFKDRGEIIGVYSIATLINGEQTTCQMAKEEVDFIKSKSQAVKSGKKSPWDDFEGEMIKKTCVKRHFKMLPKSEKMLEAAAILNEHEGIDFKKTDDRPLIPLPEATKPTTETPNIEQIDDETGNGMAEQANTENEAHGANDEEKEEITTNYTFLQYMGGFKKRLGDDIYHKHIEETYGITSSKYIIDISLQQEVLKDMETFCEEQGK